MNKKQELIEITCPACKDKSMRNPAMLKICVYGCNKCGFMGEHASMRAENERKKMAN